MVPMERLLEAWRADPREEPTVELCAMLIRAVLKATGQKILPDQFVIDFVGEATKEHAKNVEVAIACSDLFLATGLFSHSKDLLEAATEHAPRDLRVKERLLKLNRIRRPTKELASRGEDPETLDAPTTPLDPETEPVKATSVPPSPILLPRNPRRQHTVHGLAPAPSVRKQTVQGVQSPLAETTTQGPPKLEVPDTSTTTVGKEPPPRRTPPPGLRLPNTRPTPPPGQLPPGMQLPQAPKPKSDPPTRTSVDARPSDEGPPTHVDNAPPAAAGPGAGTSGAGRSLADDDGPATQAPTLVGPRGAQNDEGPPTKVGPDGPPTAVNRSVPPPAATPPASPAHDPGGPGRPPPRRAAIKRPPGRPGAPDSGPRTPPPRGAPTAPPLLGASLGPLEDSHSEQEIPTKVTALPPLGPHGLAFEPRTGVRPPAQPMPPPLSVRPPMEPAPISDGGEDEPPTQARSVAPPPPPAPYSDAGDRPTRARPVVPPPRIPAPPESDPDGDTATGVKDLSSSQEAPTLSGALTKPFSRPPAAPVDLAWQGDGAAFPAPGGSFQAEPVAAVGKGGTNVMNVGQAPGVPSFADQGPVDQQSGRTHVLSVQEAFAASQIDPRSPHSHGPEPVAMLARGQPLNPAYQSSAPPAPTFGPPPASMHPGVAAYESAPAPPAPSFGPPPGSVAPGPGMASSPPPFDAPQLPAMQAGPSYGPPGGFPDPFAQSAPDPFAQGVADPYSSQPAMPQLPTALPFPKQPAYEPPSRSFRLYVALGVAVVAVASLVGYATYLVLGDSGPTEVLPVANRPIPEELGRALLDGSPGDLLRADALLRTLEGNGAPEILLARVRERALTALEVNGEPAGIEGAVKAARGAGVPDGDLAFAEIIEALLSGKEDRALELAKAADAERTRDPYFALAYAALLERRGDPLAEERLRAAVAIEPGMRSASVRLARFLILQGKGEDAKAVYGSFPDADPARKALEALGAARAWLDARTPGARPPAEPAVITAEIPRSLHPIFSAVKLLADAEDAAEKKVSTGKSNAEAQAQLKRAIDEADSPALALFFGEIALARRDEVTAFAASSRALALAPGYPSALTVLTRASVSLGKLDQLDKLLATLPPESTVGLRAFSAYEQGNTEALAKLGQSLTDQTDPGGLVRVRLARVRGTAPISNDAIDKLLKADPVAGDLCAVDALLDAGDLTRAREIVNSWPDASSHPLRAGRAARLLRYEGKTRDAAAALSSAAPGRAVLVERILLGAETEAGREQTRSLIDERLGPDRPFWQAYLLAKSGDGDKAKSMLEVATPPVFDSPLASRVAAALAYAETGDVTRGEPIARVLLESFPKNPDVKRAAKALGIDEKH